jgi:hypothetical protein
MYQKVYFVVLAVDDNAGLVDGVDAFAVCVDEMDLWVESRVKLPTANCTKDSRWDG